MTKPPVDYLSYMLRLWRTGPDSPWKASLEDPQTGERVGFGSLEALREFLQERTVSTINSEKELTSCLNIKNSDQS